MFDLMHKHLVRSIIYMLFNYKKTAKSFIQGNFHEKDKKLT